MAEQKKQDTNQLLKVRREKLADLQANGKDPFQITKFDQTHHSLEVKELYEAHEAELLKDRETPDVEGLDEAQAREVLKKDYEERREIMDASPIHVAIAGRMMFKRVMGKASFCNIQDLQGNIQVYVARDAIGEESYADFKKSDIGDIYGIKGYVFRTKTGEISIHAVEMTLLNCLSSLKHHLPHKDSSLQQQYIFSSLPSCFAHYSVLIVISTCLDCAVIRYTPFSTFVHTAPDTFSTSPVRSLTIKRAVS